MLDKSLPVQSVGRGVAVLGLLAEAALADQAVGLPAVAEHLGVPVTTAHNLVKTLVLTGYVERDAERGYRLGPRCLDLARAAAARELQGAAGEILLAVAERTGESLVLASLLNGRRQVLQRVDGSAVVRVNPHFEAEQPLFAMVTGRVLAAFAGPTALRDILAVQGLPDGHWPAANDDAALTAALAEIRRAGGATERTSGGEVTALAVPVLDRRGRLLAALGMYLPTFRAGYERVEGLRDVLKEAAGKLAAAVS